MFLLKHSRKVLVYSVMCDPHFWLYFFDHPVLTFTRGALQIITNISKTKQLWETGRNENTALDLMENITRKGDIRLTRKMDSINEWALQRKINNGTDA